MKMVSLKLDEKDKSYGGCSPCAIGEPDYPYGTRITLDSASMRKLNLTELPAVESEMIITAKVRVVEVRSVPEGEDKRQGMELQITEMSLAPAKAVKSAEKVLYEKEEQTTT